MEREELVRQIREVGESLIKNADKLFPDLDCVEYNIDISFSSEEYMPDIVVRYNYIPIGYIRRKGK